MCLCVCVYGLDFCGSVVFKAAGRHFQINSTAQLREVLGEGKGCKEGGRTLISEHIDSV